MYDTKSVDRPCKKEWRKHVSWDAVLMLPRVVLDVSGFFQLSPVTVAVHHLAHCHQKAQISTCPFTKVEKHPSPEIYQYSTLFANPS